ncbi:MAG: hypothetical protein RhofKO_29400 [Rhodothermales bacterium]
MFSLLLLFPVYAQTASVQGRVITADTGEPLANVPVDLRSAYNTTPRVWRTTQTAADGSFALEGLPNETPHRIRAVVAGSTADFILITPPIRPDTTRYLTFAFSPPPPSFRDPSSDFIRDESISPDVITGTVYEAATGAPLPDATVAIIIAGEAQPRHMLITDAAGRFYQRIDTSLTTLFLQVAHIDYRQMTVSAVLSDEVTGRRNFYLGDKKTWAANLVAGTGSIRDQNEQVLWDGLRIKEEAQTLLTGQILSGDVPAAGATVELVGTQYSTMADTDGRFFFGELPAALYRFKITYGHHEETTPQLLVTRGPNDFSFTLDVAEN